MTVPGALGASGFNLPDRFGVTGTDGSAPQLVNNTQTYITGILKAQVKTTNSWQTLGSQFANALVAWLGQTLNLDAATQAELTAILTGNLNIVAEIQQALQGIDLSNPGTVIAAIENAAGNLFNGLIPSSWVANVVQELVPNGNFPNAQSVQAGSPFTWDGATAGAVNGFSIKTSANGTLQTMQSQMFQVAPGQQIVLSAYPQWAGLAFASGKYPIQVGITPYADKNTAGAFREVAQISPSVASSSGWAPQLTGTYTVPPTGVTWATLTLVLTQDATAGIVRYSNASAHMSNSSGLLAELQEDLTNAGNTIQAIVDAINAAVGQAAGQAVASIQAAIAGIQSLAHQAGTNLQSMIDGLLGGSNNPISAFVTSLMGTKSQAAAALTPSSTINAAQVSGVLTSGNIPNITAAMSTDLTSAVNNLTAGFQNIYNAWFGGSTAAGTPAEVQSTIAAIKTAVQNGYTVDTITSSTTWTKPANITELVVICIAAGLNGADGTQGNAGAEQSGGLGGIGGGYLVQVLDPTAVSSTVPVTIGSPASPTTSFGSYASATSGTAGGIPSQFGYTATSSTPGSGGKGGAAANVNATKHQDPGTAGTGSAIAAGGTGGSPGNAGSPGGSVSSGALTKCGGGGGGGGGGKYGDIGASAGNGGAGGFPGGGGGGGGGASAGISGASKGTGGPGGAPVVFVYYR
ncbi:Uncharacterised protein [Mycobacteroides abscessus subsp. massiliense]|uniref:glycine-rich domain-containing protein n=1 Tax=Mycobacteroides abscessus TaxID=36809 RepID=UPI0009C8D3E5|nr:hypothetical protein [Mycobacteroides abscessus]SKH54669.1 Uncharacterised protein [Mycobacteroides abscessus subsp. massiliense]SKH85189.1 Uncharacterised protein [Mycobacteroides abscessus subsp. massiliense]SKK32860.1 Uncharacterised protein [Mycobacteroides abscessus subsp. massiliense]SKK47008.1 Uncharacterised protein [Mycobacteroides abscessus subsp. massiliense]SKL88154.1 Uncharacterised protein [Mycobacteroides abscessus subsp. massiliense]